MFNTEVGGSGNAMQDYGRWNVRSQEDGKDPGYLCYYGKQNGIKVANGKQSFIICSQNNPFLHTSSKSEGMSLSYVSVHACFFLLHLICCKYVFF